MHCFFTPIISKDIETFSKESPMDLTSDSDSQRMGSNQTRQITFMDMTNFQSSENGRILDGKKAKYIFSDPQKKS